MLTNDLHIDHPSQCFAAATRGADRAQVCLSLSTEVISSWPLLNYLWVGESCDLVLWLSELRGKLWLKPSEKKVQWHGYYLKAIYFSCPRNLDESLRQIKSSSLTFEGFNRLVEAALQVELWKKDLKIELSQFFRSICYKKAIEHTRAVTQPERRWKAVLSEWSEFSSRHL